jgi:hypothetical protein
MSRNMVNKGNRCSNSGCCRPARCKGLCLKHYDSFMYMKKKRKTMKTICCDSCGEYEDEVFNPLKPMQINDDTGERSYMLCRICREKLRRILDGHAL